MLQSAKDEEINDLENYTRFIKSWARTSQSTVRILTLEKYELNVHLSDNGWELLTKDDVAYYPTLEALLMEKSPEFQKLWNDELVEKLEVLKESDS